MGVKRACFLNCGTVSAPHSGIEIFGDSHQTMILPVAPALLDTDDGYVLYDTGLHPDGIEDPDRIWGDMKSAVVDFGPENTITNQLKLAGVDPSEIKYVINSHLHFDHTGGNHLFPHATFMVQKTELRFALHPSDYFSACYLDTHMKEPEKYILLDGSTTVLGDILLLFTPGHTPGHQSMVFSLPKSGTFVLPADSAHSYANMEGNSPSGFGTYSMEEAMSVRQMNAIAEYLHGKVWVQHDPDFWKDCKPAPYWYE